jgi:hypothetical protein
MAIPAIAAVTGANTTLLTSDMPARVVAVQTAGKMHNARCCEDQAEAQTK